MGYLIGTDEAGYGPNLGPLVVAATAWEVPDPAADCDLYQLARTAIARDRRGSPRRVTLADSKSLYTPGRGVQHLERGVLAACRCLDRAPLFWRDIWPALAPDCAAETAQQPWHADFDRALPIAADADDVQATGERLRGALARVGVRLIGLRAVVVFPRRFNQLVAQAGSKGAVLSEITMALAAGLIGDCPAGDVHLVCDKHGGRNRYAGLLQQHATEELVQIVVERAELSQYRWSRANGAGRVEAHFCPRAEACAPTALASMTAKYLRELAMEPFNRFWQQHVAELRPTAGYPIDAQRFKRDIAAAQAALGIDDEVLWRNR